MKQFFWCLVHFCLATFIFFQNANCQDQQLKNTEPSSLISDIREKGLFIRLDANTKQLAYLDNIIQSNSYSAKEKERAANIKAAQITEKRIFHLQLIRSFSNYYNYSKVYFYYNSDQGELNNGKLNTGYFLNDSLEKDPSIIPLHNPVVILEEGRDASSASEILQLCLADHTPIEGRLNFNHKIYKSFSLLNRAESKEVFFQKVCNKLVKRLDKTFKTEFKNSYFGK